MKKYHFLIGVPRAGNTVISSVLNQNKKLCLTANSPLSGLLYELDLLKRKGNISDILDNFPDQNSYSKIIKNIFINYYSDWQQEYIFDRGVWGTPYHLNLLTKYFDFDFKFLIIRRRLVEVFASFMKWCDENPNNFINEITNFGDVDVKYEFLFNKNGNIMKMMSSTYEVLNSNHFHHIIWYNDFINDPQLEINKFYQVFQIDNIEHNFNDIKQLNLNGIRYDDSSYGMNMHNIRRSIEKEDYDIEKYVPSHIMKKINDIDII